MPEQNAAPTPQQPDSAPVIDASAGSQAVPSVDAKPDMFDLSPLGDSWKDIKINKAVAEKLPSILKSEHFTPELIDHLSDPMEANLYYTDIKGYRRVQNERYEDISKKDKALAEREKTFAEREMSIQAKERELAEIEGDAYFYRDEKIKRLSMEAEKEALEMGLEGDRADAYVQKITKPYIEQAKAEYQRRKEAQDKELSDLLENNTKIGREVFPEFAPQISEQLIDGLVMRGSDPKSAADLIRKELDRVIESRVALGIAEYVKKVNTKQPDVPSVKTDKPLPSAAMPDDVTERVARGRALFGFLGGK